MKTLHLCNRVPFPPQDGGAIGIYDIISNLAAQGAKVTVLAINTPKHYQPDHVLNDKARLITVFVDTSISVVRAFFNLFTTIPYIFSRFVSPAYTSQLIKLLRTENFEVVQIEGSQMAWYVPTIRQYSKAAIVLRAHNVEYIIWQRLARHEKNILKKIYFLYTARSIKQFEKKYFNQFDAIAAITNQDKERITQLGCKARLEVIPAGVETSRVFLNPAIQAKPKSLFILGSLNWLPNQEGIKWFLEQVWPSIVKENPALELHIAGTAAPDWLLELQVPNITVHGFVPDAAAFMQQYDLMLVPLLSGGGMRIKILEGMALGKCILTTKIGAEGIEVLNGKNILIAETAEEWVATISQYSSGKLPINNIKDQAAALIQGKYTNQIIIQEYLNLYKHIFSVQK